MSNLVELERKAVAAWLNRRADRYGENYHELHWWQFLRRRIVMRTAGVFRAAALCIEEGAHHATSFVEESDAIQRASAREACLRSLAVQETGEEG